MVVHSVCIRGVAVRFRLGPPKLIPEPIGSGINFALSMSKGACRRALADIKGEISELKQEVSGVKEELSAVKHEVAAVKSNVNNYLELSERR